MFKFLTRIFGSRNQRLLRQYQHLVEKANALEPKMQALRDEEFPALTAAFRERLAAGQRLGDEQILQMNYLVQGVVGRLPR